MLAYLAAGKLERLVGIWADELAEEEAALVTSGQASAYSAHAQALLSPLSSWAAQVRSRYRHCVARRSRSLSVHERGREQVSSAPFWLPQ